MTDAATRIAGLDDTQLHALHKRLDAQGVEDAAIVEAHHLVAVEMLKRGLQHGHEDDSWASAVVVMEKAYVGGPDEIEAPAGLEKAWEDALALGGTVSIILTTDGYVLKADPGVGAVHVDSLGKAEWREGDFAIWGSSGGSARGQIEHIMREGVLGIPDSDFSIDATEDDPAVLLRVFRKGPKGWAATETLVGHKMSTLRPIDDLTKEAGYDVPSDVQAAARKALKWISEGRAGDGFTSVGRGRAQQLADGGAVSRGVLVKMRAYFARHAVDKDAEEWGDQSDPTPGMVAWYAWGGNPGRTWANRVLGDLEKSLLPAPLIDDSMVEKMIRRKGSKWVVLNEEGTREFGTYDSEEEAHHRLAQMEYFKKAVKVCPPATQDVAINLKNRAKAIKVADYGPMNPNDANTEYWQEIAGEWDVTVTEAKKQRCGNCAAFNVTKEMKQCIADGIGGDEPWDVIDAGELGYCEVFKFKCAAARTCDAWIVGGPLREIEKAAEEEFDEEEFLSVLTDEDKAWYGDIAQILEEGGDPDLVLEKAGGNPEALRDYWRGGGKGKISWGAGGDFTSCVTAVSKYMSSEQAKGYCAIRHREVNGFWPGDKRNRPNMGKSTLVLPDGATYTYSMPESSVWAEPTTVLKHPGHGNQKVHAGAHGGDGGSGTVSYDPKTGPSNSEKIKNAALMYGKGSKQHEEAVRRFGAMPADVKSKVKQNLSKGSIAESYGTSHAAGKDAARIDKGNALDNATERIAKRDALMPALKQAAPRSFEGENTAFAIADHQGFIDGVSGVRPQMTTSHSFSDTVAGFMFGGLAGATKSLEIVEKHPGHGDQKVHGRKGGSGEPGTTIGSYPENVRRLIRRKPRQIAYLAPGATKPDAIVKGRDSAWDHMVPDGKGGYKFTPERQAIHEKIIAKRLDGKPSVENPTFVMMGGGGGSGKGTLLLSGLIKDLPGTEESRVHIDADEIKMELPDYRRMVSEGNKTGVASFTHEESSILTKEVQRRATARRNDILLDGTGDSSEDSLRAKIESPRAAGYEIRGEYVSAPTMKAWEQNVERAANGPRGLVPPSELVKAHQSVSQIVPKMSSEFDSFRLWDSSGGKGTQVVIATNTKGGKIKVTDSKKYKIFQDKADEVISADKLLADITPDQWKRIRETTE